MGIKENQIDDEALKAVQDAIVKVISQTSDERIIGYVSSALCSVLTARSTLKLVTE